MKEEFDNYCRKYNIRPDGDYAEDIYPTALAMWNAALEKVLVLCREQYVECLEPEVLGIANQIRALKEE